MVFLARILVLVALAATTAACGSKIGDSCTAAADCATEGGRQCDTASPGGYCTIAGCDLGTCPEEATCVQFASKLLSAASEAGVISPLRDPRTLLLPKVSDAALAYLLYLLRGLRFAGTLIEYPYLASVGLTHGFLDQRLRALPGITFRRMAQLTEFDWDAPSLSAWAEATL